MAKKPGLDELNKGLKKTQPTAYDAYQQFLNKAMAETAAYAQQSGKNRQEVANTILGGGPMTSLKQGDIDTFDWDNQRMHEIGRAAVNKAYRAMGLFDDPRYATNKGYVSLVGDEYLNSQLANLQNQLANFEKRQNTLYERNKANLPKYEADKQKAAEWRNFFDLAGLDGEPTLENMLAAEGIYNGTTARSARDFDLMDDETFDREYAALESWYKGLAPAALMADPEAPTLATADNNAILNKIGVVQSEIDRRAQLNALQNSIRSDANYGALSAYTDAGYTATDPAYNDIGSLVAAKVQDTYVHGLDELSRFLNSNASWSEKMAAAENNPTVRDYLNNGYDYMTSDELSDYNALINAGMTEEAAQYLELVRPELLYRRAMVMQEYQHAKATNAWLAAPTWVEAGAQQIANVFYLPQQIYEAAVGKDNPYSSAYDALNKSQWTTESQVGAINSADIPDWADTALTFLYKGVSGARDNAARIIAGGGNPTVALVLAGAQSASGSLHESSERNDMNGAAKIIKAIGTAAIEVGTEKIGLDALFDKGQKGALQYMKNVILSEVGEETLNAVSEPVLEGVVAYLFDHEADIMSGPEFWQNLTDTAITTAISSIFMGGGGAISNSMSTRSTGRNALENGDIEGILRIADNYTNKSDVADAANKVRDKQAKGIKVTARDMGELVNSLSNAVGEKNSKVLTDVLTDSVEGRLEELGEDPTNARKLAQSISNMYLGKKITMAERAGLKWSDAASQVFKELNSTATVSKEVVPGSIAGTEGQLEDGKYVAGDALAAEKNRVGHSWKTAADEKIVAAQRDAFMETARLNEALNTKTSTTTAVGKAHDKAKNLLKGKPKMATREVMAEGSDGKEVTGTFERVERKNGKLLMVMKDASDTEVKVDADKITNGGDEGILTIINYAQEGARHEMSTDEVNTMIKTYLHEGGDVDSFVQQFQDNYLAGYSGINAPAGTISGGVASIAYEHGKAEAVKDEADRVARAQRARKVETPSVGWLGEVTSDTSIKGLGDTGGLDEAVKNMTETQQAMVEFGRHLAKAAKINVVFFASKAGADGKYTTQNGSYDPNTHTIYLDINSGASTESGRQDLLKRGTLGAAIGRVAGHELTHVLEATSPEYYGKYKQTVNAALKAKGLDYASLVREKIDTALANGNKLTYAGAEAEVIADASEYMLQDSKFVKNMDQGLKGKVKEIVRNFLNKVNEAFRALAGGHIESTALRTITDGVAHYEKQLQDLWDMAFDEMLGAEVRTEAHVAEATGETETVQKSIRERDDAYMAAVERGDMAAAQNMVDEAARAAGYEPVKLYHGTRQFGFTKFDTDKSDDKMSIFVTDDRRIAESYSREGADIPVKNGIKQERYDFMQQSSAKLEPYVQKWVDKNLKVPTERELRAYTDGESATILSAVDWVDDYLQTNWDSLNTEAKSAISKAMFYAEKLAAIPSSDMEDETDGYALRMKFEDAVRDLAWEDRNSYEEIAPVLSRPVYESANNLISARFNDPFYNVNDGTFVSKWDVTDKLGDKLFTGIYELYGDMENLLEIDANDSNWNTIDGKTIGRDGVFVTTREVAEFAKKNGFNGVKIKNVRDGGGMTGYHAASNVLIFFDSTALKSADPVTYDDSGNVIPLSERFNAANEDIRYSLRYVDGNPVVWVDENILADKPDGQSDKVFIKNYLASHIDDVYTIIESGYKVFPSKKLPREYLYSKSATTLERFNKQKYKAKIAAVPGIGEMVGIATNRRWERLLHDANKKAKYGVYRYDTRVAFDNNGNSEAYTAELIILNAEDGKKYLYDIVGIIKDVAMSERLNERARSAKKTAYQDSNVNSSVARFYEDVKQKIQKSVRDDGSAYQSEAMTVADGMQDTDGKRMFSLRSFNEDYDTYRAMLMNHNVPLNEINGLFDTIDEVMKAIEKDREILDFGWNVGREDRSFNPVKPNSDPLYEVSLDFSTLCRKRLLQQTVQERLEAMYDTVLTKAERVAIRNELMKLREEGKQIEVACALCYVESTRLKSPAQIQRFFDDRRAVMVDYFSKKNKAYMKEVNAKADELIVKFGHEPDTKKKELNSFQKKAVENLKQSMYKQYKPSAEEEAIIATALELPGESFKTDKGLWNLKKEHEVIFDAYTSFVRNATKSKGIEGDEAWWAGDSQSISDKLIEKMNKENGLRTQSWSDFQVIHLLDYISAIIELSTRGAKMQRYTKVPDFVKLMGDTGVMINLSLIPKGFDGTLNYDPIEGMPIEEALALREMFPNTAGTICIGITDKHIRMLLADPNTDYVIPYHSSSLDKKTRQQMGMKVWEDFQSYQNEKNKDYPNTVDDNKTYRKKPLFSEWFDYNTVSERAKVVGAERAMQEAADRYIDLCHRRGLQEKFAQFAAEPNYWKLLIDRKMINQQTGEIIKQEAVQPRFNKDRILDILSAEVNRFKAQNADKDAAVEHIVNAWENGEIRKAAKSKKVRDQVSAFNDTVTVANIVASAAELDAQEQTQKSIRDLPEDTTTYRDFLAEADSSIAATIEERNALSIYQKLLKNHAEASEKVIEAETALAAADEAHKPEARKALAAARAKQKDLYNRLLNVERQAHVQTLVKRSNQIISDLYGKNQAELDKMLADKERRIASLKADITGLKGAAKTQREADIREQEREVAALKSNATKALLANSERYQRQIDEIRLRRDLNIEIGKRTRHIKRIVKRLNDRIIHEEDYKNVKEPLKPVVHKLVQTFIDGFGNMVFDQKTADRLRSVYDEIANEDGAPEFYSDDVANWLNELSDMKEWDALILAEGSSSLGAAEEKLTAYSKVAEIADHIYKLVTAADEIFIDGKREKFNAFSTETGTALVEHKDAKLLVGKARDAYNAFQNLLVKGNLTPQFFFEHLKNSGMTRLFDGLMRGQTEYAQAIREGQEAISEAKKRYNYYAWQNMKEGVQFHTEQGHDIALTVPVMMSIYATAKREAANKLMDTHHLDQGGFRYDEKNIPRQKGKPWKAAPGSDLLHKLSQADVEKISNTLTAEQKACADELVSYLSNECAAKGNRASMELYGIKKYNEEYYFPFKTDSNQRNQRSDAGAASTTNDARVKHTSFTHSLRKGANTPLVMGDFFDVIADHINLMATYSSFVVPIESMNRVMNTKINEEADGSGNDVTIRSLIGRKYGEASQKYIADLLKDLNGGPQTDNRGGLSVLFRAFKRGAVMGSLSVTLQQPTAIIRAFAYVNPKYFAHITMEGNKKTWERMMKHSGTAVIKEMGKFDVGTGHMANDWIANSDIQEYNVLKRARFLMNTEGWKAVKDNTIEFLTSMPGVMDRITWTHIWKAVEAEQADQHPGMDRNSDEFLDMVGKRFDDVINHTQVYDSVLAKSQNMRSKNPLTQMSTAFMSEPTLNANLYYSAVTGDHTAGQRAGIITSVIASNLLAAAMAALISAWNKDDDDRKFTEKYLAAFASRAVDNLNPMTMYPYLSDLWSAFSGYDIERTDLSVVTDILDYGGTFIKKIADGEDITWRDRENLYGTIANLFGIPAKNVSRDIRRIRNLINTDKSASNPSAIKYTLYENAIPLGLWKDSNKAYCQRLVAAVVDGDKQEAYDLWDYLTNTKKPSQNTINTNIRDELKRRVQEGSLTPEQATKILREYAPYKNDKDNLNKPKEWAE